MCGQARSLSGNLLDRRSKPDLSRQPLRVLYFTRDYTTHDHRFLTSLAGTGFEVFFLRLERRGRQLEDRPLPPEVTLLPWSGGQAPWRWRDLPSRLADLRAVLRRVKPDVVHAGPIQSAALLAALAGFHPLVSMSWGSDLLRDADSSRLYRWITAFTLKRTDILVGDCDAVRRKAEEFGFPRDKVYLFPWGIDLERFSPADPELVAAEGEDSDLSKLTVRNLRARLGWQDQFVVLSLRSWEPVYGVDVALRGFARAAQQAPELRLLLLGGGSQAALVHQIIQQYDLTDRVYLGGQVSQEDLPSVYRTADLYLSASHSDGSSVSLMEALASARPVLVSDIPGNREWVTPGQHGWLFPDGNDQAVADGILNALRARADQPEMGKNARRLAEERADWCKNFQVLLRAYQRAVQPGIKGKGIE
jgi:L-malate glycosyltransferase